MPVVASIKTQNTIVMDISGCHNSVFFLVLYSVSILVFWEFVDVVVIEFMAITSDPKIPK